MTLRATRRIGLLRPACTGCPTTGNPVPLQAEHLTSVGASLDFKLFMAIISWTR
jgi:hypothetical protein